MKIIFNSHAPCLPPLHVKLTYTEEFIKAFNISTHFTIVGEEYVECNQFNKVSKACGAWEGEECGSDGLTLVIKQSRNYCMFRRGDIPIWEEVSK